MVPAMVVRRCSVGKRVMRLIPERPAVSADQLSLRPTPSEVTTPMPVMATTGRPRLSRTPIAPSFVQDRDHYSALTPWRRRGSARRLVGERSATGRSLDRLDQAQAFAAPATPRVDDDRLRRRRHRLLEAGLVDGLVESLPRQRERGEA